MVGVLEVLLVGAKDLHNTNFIGGPDSYIVLQCGNQTLQSRVASGDHNGAAIWNQKLVFRMSGSARENVKHIRLLIMEKHALRPHDFLGETTINIRGILSEASKSGCIELKPAPYNVVLRDHTYCGEITVGLKFIIKAETLRKAQEQEHVTFDSTWVTERDGLGEMAGFLKAYLPLKEMEKAPGSVNLL
ncbi:hypothetical protein AMTRI_Chr07g80870 [Amborella trichopoda]